MKHRKQLRIKVYVKEEELIEMVEDSEKAGFRPKGLQPFTQKKNGFGDEKIANTDKLSKFLKHCWKEWKRGESSRIERIVELKRKEEALKREKQELGIE